jgi:hypothetical protein
VQEIKAKSLLSRCSAWNKLVYRWKCSPPPSREVTAVREVNPMKFSRFVLALFLVGVGLCDCNALSVQEFEYERSGTSNRHSDSFIGPSLKNDSEYISLGIIDWAATRSGPSALVHDEFTRTIVIGYRSVCRDVASGGKGLDRSQWETSECDWRPIGRLCDFKGNRVNAGRKQYGFADCQVHSLVKLTIDKSEPMEVNFLGASLPSAIGDINRHDAWVNDIRSKFHEVVSYMPCCQEMPDRINHESSTIDQFNIEPSSPIFGAAHYWNDGMFDAFNRREELVSLSPIGASDQNKKKSKKQQQSQESTAQVDHSHDSGPLVLPNDGKPIGCDVSHPSSASIAISCPQIDSVGAHKEVPQATKHDPSIPPPSQE